MLGRKNVLMGTLIAISLASVPVAAAPLLQNHAVDVVGAGGVSDPLIAVEANRAAIINRLMAEFGDAAAQAGVPAETFRGVLNTLRADRLLAAALVGSFAELTAIVVQTPSDGVLLQRYVALTPTVPQTLSALPFAQAYLIRNGEMLTVTRAQDLRLGEATVVGYFVAGSSVVSVSGAQITPKDGPGSGANSWIGYIAGNNVASGSGSAVAAGTFNAATGISSMVLGGSNNSANGISSLVIGGFDNHATVIDAMVGAGAGNRATGARSVVVGGGYNLASGQWSFVGGGGRDGTASTPAGTNSADNIASGNFSVVTGGNYNRATQSNATVGGGIGNTASGNYATVGGGGSNLANGAFASVSGGNGNQASGTHAFVGGGILNTAGGSASFASGNNNTAAGDFSTAIGFGAQALFDGSFVWADSKPFFFEPSKTGSGVHGWNNPTNTFNVRATGGVWFVSGLDGNGMPLTGPFVDPGSGTWAATSDRAAKENFQRVDSQAILAKVSQLPIASWNYITEGARIRHIGPVSQDFRAAFGLGRDDKSITSVDADGVALAAIQGLDALVQAQAREIAGLKEDRAVQAAKIVELQQDRVRQGTEIADLRRSVEVLLARTQSDAKVAAR